MLRRGYFRQRRTDDSAALLHLWDIRVGQRLQKGNDRLLLCLCQTEVAHLAVHVGRVLGYGPAGFEISDSFISSLGLLLLQLLQALWLLSQPLRVLGGTVEYG